MDKNKNAAVKEKTTSKKKQGQGGHTKEEKGKGQVRQAHRYLAPAGGNSPDRHDDDLGPHPLIINIKDLNQGLAKPETRELPPDPESPRR
ncbi:hypothetical protein BS78_01G134200 [Paspalum vaginatum]|nr:hypothetical protein BS78_01G134200 [Paspalum vaginatum]